MKKRRFMPGPSGVPPGNTGGTAGPLISAGLSTAGDITTQVLSNKMRRQLEQQARDWNLQQWHRQNRYNHPLEQMARLTAAGLNPNLIYGSSPGSAVGNAGAIHPGKAPEYKLNNPVSTYFDTRVKQAQTDNLQSAVNLNTANAMKSISQSGLAKSQTNQINKLLSGNLEIQQEDIKQKKIGTFLKALEKAAMTNKDKGFIARYAAQTTKAIAEGDSAQAKVELDRLNEFFAKKGLRPNDPLVMRILGMIFGIDYKKGTMDSKLKDIKTWTTNPFIPSGLEFFNK